MIYYNTFSFQRFFITSFLILVGGVLILYGTIGLILYINTDRTHPSSSESYNLSESVAASTRTQNKNKTFLRRADLKYLPIGTSISLIPVHNISLGNLIDGFLYWESLQVYECPFLHGPATFLYESPTPLTIPFLENYIYDNIDLEYKESKIIEEAFSSDIPHCNILDPDVTKVIHKLYIFKTRMIKDGNLFVPKYLPSSYNIHNPAHKYYRIWIGPIHTSINCRDLVKESEILASVTYKNKHSLRLFLSDPWTPTHIFYQEPNHMCILKGTNNNRDLFWSQSGRFYYITHNSDFENIAKSEPNILYHTNRFLIDF